LRVYPTEQKNKRYLELHECEWAMFIIKPLTWLTPNPELIFHFQKEKHVF
jgi:hypothetical protein